MPRPAGHRPCRQRVRAHGGATGGLPSAGKALCSCPRGTMPRGPPLVGFGKVEFVRKQHLNNNFTTQVSIGWVPVCWGSLLEVTVADPARNERCSRRKKKRGGSRARFKATVRHQVRTVRSPCSRRPATSDGVCNARATRSIAPLPGPGTRVRPRCPRRWEAGCCLLTGHALLFCSPVGDGRGRGRDSWDAPCSTS